MDVSKELSEASTKPSFFNHVFNMEQDSQTELMNIVQYSLIALIPVLVLNKAVQTLFPEVDESKNNIELAFEIIGQTIVMFSGMLFIHRLITYIPTYSKVDYSPLRVTNVVIAFLSIVLSIQSRIGEKANVLLDRLMSYLRPYEKTTPVAVANPVHQTPNGHTSTPMPPPQYEQQSSSFSMPPTPQLPPQSAPNTNLNNGESTMGGYGMEPHDDIMAANDSGMSWGSAF